MAKPRRRACRSATLGGPYSPRVTIAIASGALQNIEKQTPRMQNVALANQGDVLNRTTAVARVTGLEPATSGVTGRRSNQLSYTRLRRGGGNTAPILMCQRGEIAFSRSFRR